MALPPGFLDELRARTPLPGLIGQKTRLLKSGRNWKGCCPFHGEKTPSFYVYDDHFHCFGCGAHGDAVTFVMRAEGAQFMEAVERLASEAGLDVPKLAPRDAERARQARDLYTVMEAAMEAFQRRLRLPEGRPALEYLRRRGLTEETIQGFGLGWAGSGRGALQADLKQDAFETAQLIEAGLLKPPEGDEAPRDFFFNRVMFPIRDRRGRVIAFGGRILGDGQPKYINSPETPLFRKRYALYGLDRAREGAFRGASVVAVEGYMDVIALHQAGFTGAVAPLGTALTEDQLQELWRLSPEPVLCFDGDAAGARAAARVAEAALPLISAERSLKLATLPAGEDPDTLIAKGGQSAFQTVLDGARPLSEALYGLLLEGRPMGTPEQRATAEKRLLAAAATITDPSLARQYRRELLKRFFEATTTRRQSGRAVPTQRLARPALVEPTIRTAQARILLAILLRHPWLLPQIEEAFGLLDLPEGPARLLQSAILSWPMDSQRLDSQALLSHLATEGLADATAWALGAEALPQAARPDALPREVEEGFWHFFLRLRGEAALLEDQKAAQESLAATNDPAAQQRLIRLTEALGALRRGEDGADMAEDTAATP
ncbi:MAG: DNA primase [Roseomonas sp.]|nr:DNA primase [Roseomonas sp.]